MINKKKKKTLSRFEKQARKTSFAYFSKMKNKLEIYAKTHKNKEPPGFSELKSGFNNDTRLCGTSKCFIMNNKIASKKKKIFNS